MRKLVLLFLFFFILSGCKASPRSVEEATRLDQLLKEKKVAYDLRSLDQCEIGHIDGFLCVDYGSQFEPSEQAIYNITNKYSQYKKSDIILLISNETDISKYVASELAKKGYKNVYYFIGGYDEYVRQKGDSFIPKVGCDC